MVIDKNAKFSCRKLPKIVIITLAPGRLTLYHVSAGTRSSALRWPTKMWLDTPGAKFLDSVLTNGLTVRTSFSPWSLKPKVWSIRDPRGQFFKEVLGMNSRLGAIIRLKNWNRRIGRFSHWQRGILVITSAPITSDGGFECRTFKVWVLGRYMYTAMLLYWN
jgi:hypothetical protein